MAEISGTCLCGEVAFTCENTFKSFHLCHCVQCQKASGSAHVANLFTKADNIHWQKGEAKVVRYDMPGRTISTAFCSTCGTPMPYLSGSGKALIVPAGCLDGAPNISPQDHIFWSERAAWYDGVSGTVTYDGFPE